MTLDTSGEVPRESALSKNLSAAELEENSFDAAYLEAIALHEHFTKREVGDFENVREFKSPQDGHVFLQAGVPHGDKDFYKMEEINPESMSTPIEIHMFAKGEAIRIRQANMLQVPVDRDPYLFLTMSVCSAVVARDKESLFVAHVGLSERDGLRQFVEYIQSQGVMPENMYAIANLTKGSVGVKTDLFDASRVESVAELVNLGIPEENIKSFTYKRGDPLVGVVATPKHIGSYSFDYEKKDGREIVGNIQDFSFTPTNIQ